MRMGDTEVGLGLNENVVLADKSHFEMMVMSVIVLLSEFNQSSSVNSTCIIKLFGYQIEVKSTIQVVSNSY